MTFLVMKIFVYLLTTLTLGVAAGWLWRHREAAAREDRLGNELMEARGRLLPLETKLASQEKKRLHSVEQATALEVQLADRDRTVEQLTRGLELAQRRVEELQLERDLQHRTLVAQQQQLELARPQAPRQARG